MGPIIVGQKADGVERLQVFATASMVSAFREIQPAAEAALGMPIEIVMGAAAGDLSDRIRSGAPFDVAILTPALNADFIKAGVLEKQTYPVAEVAIGVGYTGTPPTTIDLTTHQGVAQAFTGAAAVNYAPTGMGAVTYRKVVADLKLEGKVKEATAAGQAASSEGYQLFVAPLSEFPPNGRATKIGPLPRDLQIPVQIDIAISSKAAHAAWAARFITYLRSAEVGQILAEKGFTPRTQTASTPTGTAGPAGAGPAPRAPPPMPSTAQFQGIPVPPDPVINLPDNVEGLLDLTYLERVGFRPLTLDLYRKRDSAGRRPVVVYIHGGSFMAGDGRITVPAVKAGMDGFAAMLAAKGYAVANVNYRLGGEAHLPAGILDMKAAIRWLRANADKYGLDPDRFAVFGESAGGQAAALLGTSCGAERLSEKLPPSLTGGPDLSQYSDCVQAAIDWFGVIDMATLDTMMATTPEVKSTLKHNGPNSTQSKSLGCVLGSTCTDEQVQVMNPLSYLDDSDKKVSFLTMHGSMDTAVSWKQAQMFHDQLKAKGVSSQLLIVPGVDHYFIGATEKDIAQINTMLLDFLQRTIGAKR